MKKISVLQCMLALFLTLTSCGKEQVKLLVGGSGWNKVAIIDKQTKQIEWEYPLEKGWECNSVACTDDGDILFSYRKGARLVSRDHTVVFDIPSPEGCEMQTADVLPDGNILLAWTGHPATILEADPSGNIISRTEFETGIDHPHSQFRQVSKNRHGNYIIPLMGGKTIYEVTPQGTVVNTITPGSNYFTVLCGDDDMAWASCGDTHRLIKTNIRTGEVKQEIGENDIDGVRLFFVAGLSHSADGGLYICNWQGHSREARQMSVPQLIEVDRDFNVVWSLNDNEKFGMISDVCVMRK